MENATSVPTARASNDPNKPKMEYEDICVEVLTYIGAISALVNLILVFVIVKFRKLRHDSTNQIFIHVNILQGVFLIVVPLLLRYSDFSLDREDSKSLNRFCALFQIVTFVGFGLVALFILFIYDSHLKIYNQDKYQKFIKSYKYIFIAIYLLIVVISAGTYPVSLILVMTLGTPIALLVLVIIFTIVLIIVNINHRIKKNKLTNYDSSNIGLVISNILVVFLIPCIVAILVSLARLEDESVIKSIYILGILPVLTPIFNLIYVYLYDKTYRMCLRQIFKCQCNNYESEDIEQPVDYHTVPNGVQN